MQRYSCNCHHYCESSDESHSNHICHSRGKYLRRHQVAFGANIGNYGVTPIYDWRIDGVPVGTGSTYSSNTLTNRDIITLSVTADATTICPATTISNAITMTVNPAVTPTVSITGPSTPVCPGSNVTFLGESGLEWWYIPIISMVAKRR